MSMLEKITYSIKVPQFNLFFCSNINANLKYKDSHIHRKKPSLYKCLDVNFIYLPIFLIRSFYFY